MAELRALGARHAGYGAEPAHFLVAHDALSAAVSARLKVQFVPPAAHATFVAGREHLFRFLRVICNVTVSGLTCASSSPRTFADYSPRISVDSRAARAAPSPGEAPSPSEMASVVDASSSSLGGSSPHRLAHLSLGESMRRPFVPAGPTVAPRIPSTAAVAAGSVPSHQRCSIVCEMYLRQSALWRSCDVDEFFCHWVSQMWKRPCFIALNVAMNGVLPSSESSSCSESSSPSPLELTVRCFSPRSLARGSVTSVLLYIGLLVHTTLLPAFCPGHSRGLVGRHAALIFRLTVSRLLWPFFDFFGLAAPYALAALSPSLAGARRHSVSSAPHGVPVAVMATAGVPLPSPATSSNAAAGGGGGAATSIGDTVLVDSSQLEEVILQSYFAALMDLTTLPIREPHHSAAVVDVLGELLGSMPPAAMSQHHPVAAAIASGASGGHVVSLTIAHVALQLAAPMNSSPMPMTTSSLNLLETFALLCPAAPVAAGGRLGVAPSAVGGSRSPIVTGGPSSSITLPSVATVLDHLAMSSVTAQLCRLLPTTATQSITVHPSRGPAGQEDPFSAVCTFVAPVLPTGRSHAVSLPLGVPPPSPPSLGPLAVTQRPPAHTELPVGTLSPLDGFRQADAEEVIDRDATLRMIQTWMSWLGEQHREEVVAEISAALPDADGAHGGGGAMSALVFVEQALEWLLLALDELKARLQRGESGQGSNRAADSPTSSSTPVAPPTRAKIHPLPDGDRRDTVVAQLFDRLRHRAASRMLLLPGAGPFLASEVATTAPTAATPSATREQKNKAPAGLPTSDAAGAGCRPEMPTAAEVARFFRLLSSLQGFHGGAANIYRLPTITTETFAVVGGTLAGGKSSESSADAPPVNVSVDTTSWTKALWHRLSHVAHAMLYMVHRKAWMEGDAAFYKFSPLPSATTVSWAMSIVLDLLWRIETGGPESGLGRGGGGGGAAMQAAAGFVEVSAAASEVTSINAAHSPGRQFDATLTLKALTTQCAAWPSMSELPCRLQERLPVAGGTFGQQFLGSKRRAAKQGGSGGGFDSLENSSTSNSVSSLQRLPASPNIGAGINAPSSAFRTVAMSVASALPASSTTSVLDLLGWQRIDRGDMWTAMDIDMTLSEYVRSACDCRSAALQDSSASSYATSSLTTPTTTVYASRDRLQTLGVLFWLQLDLAGIVSLTRMHCDLTQSTAGAAAVATSDDSIAASATAFVTATPQEHQTPSPNRASSSQAFLVLRQSFDAFIARYRTAGPGSHSVDFDHHHQQAALVMTGTPSSSPRHSVDASGMMTAPLEGLPSPPRTLEKHYTIINKKPSASSSTTSGGSHTTPAVPAGSALLSKAKGFVERNALLSENESLQLELLFSEIAKDLCGSALPAARKLLLDHSDTVICGAATTFTSVLKHAEVTRRVNHHGESGYFSAAGGSGSTSLESSGHRVGGMGDQQGESEPSGGRVNIALDVRIFDTLDRIARDMSAKVFQKLTKTRWSQIRTAFETTLRDHALQLALASKSGGASGWVAPPLLISSTPSNVFNPPPSSSSALASHAAASSAHHHSTAAVATSTAPTTTAMEWHQAATRRLAPKLAALGSRHAAIGIRSPSFTPFCCAIYTYCVQGLLRDELQAKATTGSLLTGRRTTMSDDVAIFHVAPAAAAAGPLVAPIRGLFSHIVATAETFASSGAAAADGNEDIDVVKGSTPSSLRIANASVLTTLLEGPSDIRGGSLPGGGGGGAAPCYPSPPIPPVIPTLLFSQCADVAAFLCVYRDMIIVGGDTAARSSKSLFDRALQEKHVMRLLVAVQLRVRVKLVRRWSLSRKLHHFTLLQLLEAIDYRMGQLAAQHEEQRQQQQQHHHPEDEAVKGDTTTVTAASKKVSNNNHSGKADDPFAGMEVGSSIAEGPPPLPPHLEGFDLTMLDVDADNDSSSSTSAAAAVATSSDAPFTSTQAIVFVKAWQTLRATTGLTERFVEACLKGGKTTTSSSSLDPRGSEAPSRVARLAQTLCAQLDHLVSALELAPVPRTLETRPSVSVPVKTSPGPSFSEGSDGVAASLAKTAPPVSLVEMQQTMREVIDMAPNFVSLTARQVFPTESALSSTRLRTTAARGGGTAAVENGNPSGGLSEAERMHPIVKMSWLTLMAAITTSQ